MPVDTARLRRLLGIAFLAVVLLFVARLVHRMEWTGALQALRELPLQVVLISACLAAASHLLYCGYDLIGRHQTGHKLTVPQVATVGFMSYAFNLNLGSLIGGIGLRYRLYGRLGLPIAVTSQVLAFSMLTNWLGHLALTGAVLLLAPPLLPTNWQLTQPLLQGLGAALCLVVAAYLLLCRVSRRRTWRARGVSVTLPTQHMALLQLLLSATNWLLIAGVIWVLLQQRVVFADVLGVLLLAAVAGVVTHVPAGLGVLEAVFVTLLGHRVAEPDLLAALLAYRLLYYLVPLAAAGGLLMLGRPQPSDRKGSPHKTADALAAGRPLGSPKESADRNGKAASPALGRAGDSR